MEDRIIDVKDVQKLCKVQKTKAYEIIKKCNQKLEEKGYLIFSKGKTTLSMLVDTVGLQIKIDKEWEWATEKK